MLAKLNLHSLVRLGVLDEVLGLLPRLPVFRAQRGGHRLHRVGHHCRRRRPGRPSRLLPLTFKSLVAHSFELNRLILKSADILARLKMLLCLRKVCNKLALTEPDEKC